jgi:hypothetical protein
MLILTYIISILVKIVNTRFIDIVNIKDIEFKRYQEFELNYYLDTFNKIDIT